VVETDAAGFDALMKRWDGCVNVGGAYRVLFEKSDNLQPASVCYEWRTTVSSQIVKFI
jgi:hypothetical protein